MPRRVGTKRRTTPEWAREENDEALLRTLGNYADGLRLMELYELVKGIMTKPTVIASKKRLLAKNAIIEDRQLKRYRITTKGFEDLRTGAIKRVMASPDIAYQPPLADRTLNRALFASLYLMANPSRQSDSIIGEGYLAGEKKRQETSWKSWLYYIAKYATERKLLKSDLSSVVPQDLIRIWSKLFPSPVEIVVAEYLNSETLLHWLKTTPEASAALHNAISTFPEEALEVR